MSGYLPVIAREMEVFGENCLVYRHIGRKDENPGMES